MFTSKRIDWSILHLQKSIKWSTTAGGCVGVYRWCGPWCGGGWRRGRGGCCKCAESWCDSRRAPVRSRHCFCYFFCFFEGVTTSNWGQNFSFCFFHEEKPRTLSIEIQIVYLVKWWYSASVLTLFRTYGVKVHTAASIVHTHVVTLTFPLCSEGATATHTGLCGNAVCLFQCEMT